MKLRSKPLILFALVTASCGSPGIPIKEPTPAVQGPGQSVSEPLVVVDRDGQSHNLSSAMEGGRPVVLVFWQSWCGSCLKEAPQLAKDSRQWGKDLSFYGVVPGPADAVDELAIDRVIEKFALPHPQLRDMDLALTKRFKIEGTPTILILGPGEEVLYRSHDLPADWGRWAPKRN